MARHHERIGALTARATLLERDGEPAKAADLYIEARATAGAHNERGSYRLADAGVRRCMRKMAVAWVRGERDAERPPSTIPTDRPLDADDVFN